MGTARSPLPVSALPWDIRVQLCPWASRAVETPENAFEWPHTQIKAATAPCCCAAGGRVGLLSHLI